MATALKANLNVLAGLREALAKVQALSDVEGDAKGNGRADGAENGTCAVPADVREAVRLYVESWVEGPLAAAIRVMEGSDDYEDRAYLHSIRTGSWFDN